MAFEVRSVTASALAASQREAPDNGSPDGALHRLVLPSGARGACPPELPHTHGPDQSAILVRLEMELRGLQGAIAKKWPKLARANQFSSSDGGSSGGFSPDPFRPPIICAPILATGQRAWFDRITAPVPLDGVKTMNEE